MVTFFVAGCMLSAKLISPQTISRWKTDSETNPKIIIYYAEQPSITLSRHAKRESIDAAVRKLKSGLAKILLDKGYKHILASEQLTLPSSSLFDEKKLRKKIKESPPKSNVQGILFFTLLANFTEKGEISSMNIECWLYDVSSRQLILYDNGSWMIRRKHLLATDEIYRDIFRITYMKHYVFTEREYQFIDRVVSNALRNLPIIK